MSDSSAIHMTTGQPSFDAVAFDRAPSVEASLRADDGIGALVVTHPEPWEADMPDHPEHVLLVRLKPSTAPVEVRVADRTYAPRMPVGSFALLPAGAPSRWRDRGKGLRGLHVNLAPRVFERLVEDDEEAGPLRDLPPIDWTEDPELARLAQRLLAEATRPERGARLAIQTLAAMIGVRLLRTIERVPVSRGRCTLSAARLRRVQTFVEANLDQPLDLFALASVAALSPSHFAHAFRATTGVPPHRWVMSRRVERAREMLVSTRLPIVEIALACGFASQSHMNDVFRRHMMPTPLFFRVGERAEAAPAAGGGGSALLHG
jgi:AraC family transcriptional regulator